MSTRHSFESSFPGQHQPFRREPLPLPEPSRRVDSATLFRGEHEIGIEHRGSLYRLKITRQGKLILNK